MELRNLIILLSKERYSPKEIILNPLDYQEIADHPFRYAALLNNETLTLLGVPLNKDSRLERDHFSILF
jgi:hypothetical protein